MTASKVSSFATVGLALVAAVVLGRFTFGGEALLAGDVLAHHHPPYSEPGAPRPKNPLDADPVLCTFPRAASVATSLHAGRGAPRWEPGLGAGEPAALVNATAPDYPPWRLAYTVLPDWIAHGAVVVSHLALALAGAFFLARRRGASPHGALVAALVYGLSGHLSVWLELEVWTIAAAWLPWALLGLERGGARGVALSGFALGAAILGGHLQVAALACALALVWRPRLGVAAVLLGLALGAPRLLPALVELRESARETIPFERYFDETGSLTPQRLRLLVAPDRDDPVGGVRLPSLRADKKHEPQANGQELRFSPGAVALALALAGLARRRLKVPLLALGVLLLAAPTPLVWPLWRFGPGFGATTPTRVLALFPLLAGLLAAEGFDLLRARPRLVAGALGVVAAALVLEGALGGAVTTRAVMKPLGLAVAGLSAAFLADGSSRRVRRFAGAVLVALVAFDLAEATARWNPTCDPALLYPEKPLVAATRDLVKGERVLLDRSVGHDILLPRGIRNLGSYGSSHPARFAHLMDAIGPAGSGTSSRQWLSAARTPQRWRDSLAVRGVLVARPREGPTVKEGLVLHAGADAHLFANATALPRARVWPERAAHVARDEKEALEVARRIDPRIELVVEGDEPRAGSPCEPVAATIVEDGAERVVVRARASAPSLLVLMDTWASGWSATVDGEVVPVLHADVAFRAVRLSAGEHTVAFAFAPPGFDIGRVLAVFALAVILSLASASRASNGSRSSDG